MKKIIISSLLIGSIAYGGDIPSKTNLTSALNANYAELIRYSRLTDDCFKSLSENKEKNLEKCESYQQMVKDIEVRVQRLEDMKRRYYGK